MKVKRLLRVLHRKVDFKTIEDDDFEDKNKKEVKTKIKQKFKDKDNVLLDGIIIDMSHLEPNVDILKRDEDQINKINDQR